MCVDSYQDDVWWKGIVIRKTPAGVHVYMPGEALQRSSAWPSGNIIRAADHCAETALHQRMWQNLRMVERLLPDIVAETASIPQQQLLLLYGN